MSTSVSAAGWREIPPARIRPEPVPRVLQAPLTVRRSVVLPDLPSAVWTEAVVAVERAFRRPGVEAGAGDDRRWTASPTRRRSQIRLTAQGVAGGTRVQVEHVRPRPRPWLAAITWLCLPGAGVVAAVLLGRPATLNDWSVAAALLAVPIVAAVVMGVVEWSRSLAVLRQIRRILGRVDRAAWRARAVWVEAHEMPSEDQSPDLDLPQLDTPLDLGPAEWLALDEWEGLADARPARVAPQDLRRARRVVERVTAERRDAMPEGFAEWRPNPTTWTN